jgi:hypothetical protein
VKKIDAEDFLPNNYAIRKGTQKEEKPSKQKNPKWFTNEKTP